MRSERLTWVLRLSATVGLWYVALVAYMGLWPGVWLLAATLPAYVYLNGLAWQLSAIAVTFASGTTSWTRMLVGVEMAVPSWLLLLLLLLALWVTLVLTPPVMLTLPVLAMRLAFNRSHVSLYDDVFVRYDAFFPFAPFLLMPDRWVVVVCSGV